MNLIIIENLNRSILTLEIPKELITDLSKFQRNYIVLNQPKRDKFFDPKKQFIPQKILNLI